MSVSAFVRVVTGIAALASLAGSDVTLDTAITFKLASKNGLVLSIRSASLSAGAEAVLSTDSDRAGVWHLMPAGNNQYRIVNQQSGEVLGAGDSSNSTNARVRQWPDTGSAGHLWQVVEAGDGYSKIRNVKSGFVLGVAGHSKSPGSSAVLCADDGDPSQWWKLVSVGKAYSDPDMVYGDTKIHDPSMVKTADGTYYLFGTHDRIQMRSSEDRIHFAATEPAFSVNPSWSTKYIRDDLWAPDVSFHEGRYWLYYSASRWGKNASAIGLAISATAGPGTWSDQGIVYSSQSSDNYNAIDPGLVVDASGKWWLSFGSFWDGIQLIEIDSKTGKQAPWDTTRHALARRTVSTAIEGAYIYPHDKHYYLFVSLDQCCHGVNSTYHIAVGRSTSVTGPYYDKAAVAMSQGGGSIILSTHGNVVGPGGQTVMRDAGIEFLVYHYYDGNHQGARTLGMNRIGWDSEDWPYIQ